nr:LysR substrate-binding domain-containing protein [uncultured Shinella sp.]
MKLNLDMDVLRTFSTGVELGSYAKAAERLGRSTSAVSAQLKKLEEQAGVPVFRKSGRGLALTEAGEIMLAYARRLLHLNDEAVAALKDVHLEGWVKLGLQEDFGETLLPQVLGQFTRANPRVKVEARVTRNAELLEQVAAGKLDLALAWGNGSGSAYSERIASIRLCWIRGVHHQELVQGREPIPLLALDNPCLMRSIATKALDEAGIAWRIAFVGSSLASLWAAAKAGLGVTVRTKIGLPDTVVSIVPSEGGLPQLSSLELSLLRSVKEPPPAARALSSIIRGEVGEHLNSDIGW